ncbi:hypothetical protein AAFM46_01710 [Arthrobacter sp. TMP15]|uniref:hypothetical protein n=1 Tax=Arthrobacter sp. TMP15 TaxID=3140789 RepID=UPI0031BA359D
MMQKLTAILTVSAVRLLGAGCSPDHPWQRDSQPCMPPPLFLSTDTASPGDPVTISANDATCDPQYGEGAQVKVEVFDSVGNLVWDRKAPMNDAGGFTYRFEVPDSAVPGTWLVSAAPHDLDWCDDTGKNNRVGLDLRSETIQRVSCALRALELVVTP